MFVIMTSPMTIDDLVIFPKTLNVFKTEVIFSKSNCEAESFDKAFLFYFFIFFIHFSFSF